MMVGDSTSRTEGFGFTNLYRCYTDGPFEPNPMGVSSNDTYAFPKKHCPGGMRVNVFFPR